MSGSSVGHLSPFVAKLNNTGTELSATWIWAHYPECPQNTGCVSWSTHDYNPGLLGSNIDLVIDDFGSIFYTAGAWTGSSSTNPSILKGTVVVKLDENGSRVWSRNSWDPYHYFTELDSPHGSSIGIDSDGNIFVLGRFKGKLNLWAIMEVAAIHG